MMSSGQERKCIHFITPQSHNLSSACHSCQSCCRCNYSVDSLILAIISQVTIYLPYRYTLSYILLWTVFYAPSPHPKQMSKMNCTISCHWRGTLKGTCLLPVLWTFSRCLDNYLERCRVPVLHLEI